VLLLSCNMISAQHYSFNIEGINIEFNYQIDKSMISESVVLKNETNNSIYVPFLSDTSLYYFVLQKSVYSYFGITRSLLGPANLGGRVLLREVKGGDSINVDIVVPYSGQTLETYHIGVDFIKEEDLKQRGIEVDEKINKISKTKDYMVKCKTFYFISNPILK